MRMTQLSNEKVERSHANKLNSVSSPKWISLNKTKYTQDYKPISDYALIGDETTCALVSLAGSIDWFCVPRFDSPSVFGSLLDRKQGGTFEIIPQDEEFEARQYYEGLTNILVTEFRTTSSLTKVIDFMPCFDLSGQIVSTGEIHRRICCIEGTSKLEIRVEPRLNYGSIVPQVVRVDNTGYSFIPPSDNAQQLTLITDIQFEEIGGSLSTILSLNKGDHTDFALRYGGFTLQHTTLTHTNLKLKETGEYWKKWARDCKYDGKWKEQVIRSALTLKMLTYSRTGAIIAAPTTSLPEQIHGTRNWDYRYSWIRDSSFVLWALHSLGHKEAEKLYSKLLTSMFYLSAESMQVMLGVTGERVLTERTLDNLEGYCESFPVRVGNGAWNQFQLDVYGVFLDAMYFSHKHGRTLSKRIYQHLIEPVLESVKENWNKPDCGIWEVRGEEKHFVYSKVWCWVAVDRGVKIAESLKIREKVDEWKSLRDQIKIAVMERGWSDRMNSFVRDFDSTDLDSANLLMPQVGFISGDDPKMLSTIEQIRNNLMRDGKFLYRYKTNDGLPGEEGAFLICSFWLVSCLALAGRLNEAEELLDSLLEHSNHVGLFSEEIDPASKIMLGNFPQAFTHMGFIAAATTIEEQKRKLAMRSS